MTNIQTTVFIFLLIFVSDDTVLFGTNIDENYIIFKYFIYIIMFVYILSKRNFLEKSTETNRKYYVIIIFIMFSFCSTLITNSEIRNGNILQAIVISLSAIISIRLDLKTFLDKYSNVIFYISSFSLVVFVISILFRPALEFLPSIQNYEDVEFLNAGLAVVFKDPGIVRNLAFFREPGVFGIYLLVALIIELFYNDRPDPKKVFIIIVSLLTTLSTASFLIAFVILLGYFFRQSPGKAMSILATTAVLIYAFYDPLLTVFSKFDEGSAQYSSALARTSSFFVPFYIFASSPIFGSGLTGFYDEYFLVSQQLYGFYLDPSQYSTNTILNMFAIYGIIMGLFWLVGLFKFSACISRKPIITFITYLSFILIFSSQELRFSLFFTCLVMFGLLSATERRVQ